jgi:D-alanyl-D-alanine carboxypeptidase
MKAFDQGDMAARINQAAKTAYDEYQLIGLSIGLLKDSQIIQARGFGYSRLETKTPATEKTIYRIASITKQFTAVATMRFVERGRLSLDDELTKFFPDYPTQGRRITIHHLLTHTSGIKNYTDLGARWQDKSRLILSHDEFIEIFKNEPFDFLPNERFNYSNSGYRLLGKIIEKLSGKSYADYLKEHIFAPLEMNDTTANEMEIPARDCASSYEFLNGSLINHQSLGIMQTHAAGAIYSNVTDLLKWQQALIENKLISRESYELMLTPATLSNGRKTLYGYGFGIDIRGGRVGHSGQLDGFRSQLSFYPKDNLTVAVLSNTASADTDSIEKRIARIILNQSN